MKTAEHIIETVDASVNITMNRYVHPTMELKQENMQRLSTLLAVK